MRGQKRPNEKKMSDGGRARASVGVGVLKSSQNWSVQRCAFAPVPASRDQFGNAGKDVRQRDREDEREQRGDVLKHEMLS